MFKQIHKIPGKSFLFFYSVLYLCLISFAWSVSVPVCLYICVSVLCHAVLCLSIIVHRAY